jgi:hypothetical protein
VTCQEQVGYAKENKKEKLIGMERFLGCHGLLKSVVFLAFHCFPIFSEKYGAYPRSLNFESKQIGCQRDLPLQFLRIETENICETTKKPNQNQVESPKMKLRKLRRALGVLFCLIRLFHFDMDAKFPGAPIV